MRYGDFNFDNSKLLADKAADRIYFARFNGKTISRKEAIFSVMPNGQLNTQLFNRVAKALDRLEANLGRNDPPYASDGPVAEDGEMTLPGVDTRKGVNENPSPTSLGIMRRQTSRAPVAKTSSGRRRS